MNEAYMKDLMNDELIIYLSEHKKCSMCHIKLQKGDKCISWPCKIHEEWLKMYTCKNCWIIWRSTFVYPGIENIRN